VTTYLEYSAWDVVPRERMGVAIGSEYAWNGEAWQHREKIANAPAERELSIKVVMHSKAERRALRDWFDTMRGSLAPFWIQSFKCDLVVATPCPQGTETIYIENHGEVQGLYDISRHVYAPRTGQRFKASSPAKQADGSIALTVPPLASTLAAGDELQILLLVRFAEDVLRIESVASKGGDIAVANIRLRELQRETP
jgi:hypothetical protein